MIPSIDLKEQYRLLQDEVLQAVTSVLQDGWFILGRRVEAFEPEFAAYCGVAHGVGVASGTDALHLALLSCGVGAGDEVVTVPNTAVFTVLAISATGARPVLVDIDPVSYNMDPGQLQAAITPHTKAIIPVHLYGQPADMDPILEIAHQNGLKVIEDACQAHGAEYKGRRVGSLGDLGCFSFYPTKNLGAYGDGGMVVTDDAQMAEHLRLLRNGGQRDRYHHVVRGVNSRLDELQAAVLQVKLRRLEEWNEARRSKAFLYNQLLANGGVVIPRELPYARHVYHLYVIRSQYREELQRYLKDHDVSTLIHYPVPVHLQEAYQDLGLTAGSFPKAEQCADEVLSLPMYPELGEYEVRRVASLIRDFHAG